MDYRNDRTENNWSIVNYAEKIGGRTDDAEVTLETSFYHNF